MEKQFKIRDLRKKEKYFVDDAYLNGYARLCGVYATAVYNSLSRHANFHSQECYPSIETIAEQHNIDRKTVIKGISKLEEWGIIKKIKEKDNQTKRQLNNVYILLDKSEWVPKPYSRVDEIHADAIESRVDDIPKPSPSEGKSRVDEKDCKDNKEEKDNKCNVSNGQAVAGVDQTINSFLELFKEVNPSYKRMFANTTERSAMKRLIKEHGEIKMARVIQVLQKIISIPYAPKITTPYQLERDFGKLVSFYQQEKNKSLKLTNKIGYVK